MKTDYKTTSDMVNINYIIVKLQNTLNMFSFDPGQGTS